MALEVWNAAVLRAAATSGAPSPNVVTRSRATASAGLESLALFVILALKGTMGFLFFRMAANGVVVTPTDP